MPHFYKCSVWLKKAYILNLGVEGSICVQYIMLIIMFSKDLGIFIYLIYKN